MFKLRAFFIFGYTNLYSCTILSSARVGGSKMPFTAIETHENTSFKYDEFN